MKYLVLLGDGMADEPLDELGGKTPLEYARTPHMDRVAREGKCGLLSTVPPGFEAGSDIANLSILGYDPARYYTGRGPLEAASLGIRLEQEDVAYRCNLVTVEQGIMQDFTSGHISSSEGRALFAALSATIRGVSLYPGMSYRNLLVVSGGKGAVTTPPHDIVGQEIQPHLPTGPDATLLRRAIEESARVLADHPVNRDRINAGKLPATLVWPWSGGKKPLLPTFREKYGRTGAMISAVDLLKGIATYAGMKVITVPGATGFLDTDYQAKARYALKVLQDVDFVYVHVEAPDEAAHMGNLEEKIRAIEAFDGVVGTVLANFDGVLTVLPDHPTPLRIKTHTHDPVPFAVWGKGKDGCIAFSEREAARGSLGHMKALDLLSYLFQ
ncbi:MAG: cofactor-independent phosphoglycerate mutase [Methanomicrobiales archaeon]|nr:cofactor-independent phosphoglycerate mutase [Methanomicrobiales archaeon]